MKDFSGDLVHMEGKRITKATLIPCFTDRGWPCRLRIECEDGSAIEGLLDRMGTRVEDGERRAVTMLGENP